jgi:hypothetical protein
MINKIKATGVVSSPSREEVSVQVMEALLEMHGLSMIQNA